MSASSPDPSLSRCFARLLAILADKPGWVAFSGGVDSTLLLKAVSEVNSSSVVALFADSPLQSEFDRDNAGRLAAILGVQLLMVPYNPWADPDFTANAADRCYLCKKTIFAGFKERLPAGFVLMDGTNCDDLGVDRPGSRAIKELGVISPLVLAGLTKTGIRELSRRLGLPNWHRPASSCLATRIPTGLAITPKRLRHIEECESMVRNHGMGHIRARIVEGRPDDLVVELAQEEMALAGFGHLQKMIVEDLRRVVGGNVAFLGRPGVFCSR